MNIFQTRDDYISTLANNLIICEIGVFLGNFSKLLFKTNPKELHLIDPFNGNFCSGDKDGKNIKCADLNISYNNLCNIYKNNKNVFIHRGTSQEILKSFPKHYFDFIYIDADHSYDAVKSDLLLCREKIKIGGIISGHDYNKEKYPGVFKAVKEYCLLNNTFLSFITKDECPSFGIKNI